MNRALSICVSHVARRGWPRFGLRRVYSQKIVTFLPLPFSMLMGGCSASGAGWESFSASSAVILFSANISRTFLDSADMVFLLR